MKIILAGAAFVLAAACTPTPASEPEAAASGVTLDQPAPAAPPTIALPAGLVGRWGITAEACAPENVPKDGVFEIFADRIGMGLDECQITRAEPEGQGVHVVATCRSNIDDEADYERDFSFVSASPDTMTWVKEGGDGEPYVRCK